MIYNKLNIVYDIDNRAYMDILDQLNITIDGARVYSYDMVLGYNMNGYVQV